MTRRPKKCPPNTCDLPFGPISARTSLSDVRRSHGTTTDEIVPLPAISHLTALSPNFVPKRTDSPLWEAYGERRSPHLARSHLGSDERLRVAYRSRSRRVRVTLTVSVPAQIGRHGAVVIEGGLGTCR
jgi:hypothetical protein